MGDETQLIETIILQHFADFSAELWTRMQQTLMTLTPTVSNRRKHRLDSENFVFARKLEKTVTAKRILKKFTKIVRQKIVIVFCNWKKSKNIHATFALSYWEKH